MSRTRQWVVLALASIAARLVLGAGESVAYPGYSRILATAFDWEGI